MKNLVQRSSFRISFISLLLVFSSACVMTPDGIMPPVGVDVIPPSIAVGNDSFVSVRVGPGFYASDAYLLAYDHCLNRGLYAYEVSPWAASAGVVRTLGYDCRPNFIAPPFVRRVHRRNRWRYDYFQDYYRTHTPGRHYRTSGGGWWGGRNNRNSNNYRPPNRPDYSTPRRSRDGRALTPNSPWTNNPNKNRYQPRNRGGNRNNAPARSRWWGGRNNRNGSDRPSTVAPAPRTSSTPKSRGGFWGNKNESKNKSKNKYKKNNDSKYSSEDKKTFNRDYSSRTERKGRFSPSTRRDSSSATKGSAKKSGWFGR